MSKQGKTGVVYMRLTVFFNAKLTSAEAVTEALSRIMQTALSTSDVLSEVGNPLVLLDNEVVS